MNPDNQRGNLQPNPAPATRPLNPAQSIHPVQPIQPARFPSQTVTPEAMAAALAEPQSQPPQPVAPPVVSPAPVLAPAAAPVVSEPAPIVEPTPVPAAPIAEQPTDNEVGADEYDDEDDEQFADDDAVTWTAKEYIHHEKDTKWFMIFGIVGVALLAVSIFFMKSVSFSILLVVIAIGVVVYSRRPPRELTYVLSDEGLTIDNVLNEFDKFKSFGVIQDGAEYSIMLIPTQRFQPGVTVYFPEEAGEDIVDMLGSRMPMKELHLDAVDRLIRLIRL